ncbi:hypothetical protein C7381_1195, partial [Ezakiella coagulans]
KVDKNLTTKLIQKWKQKPLKKANNKELGSNFHLRV